LLNIKKEKRFMTTYESRKTITTRDKFYNSIRDFVKDKITDEDVKDFISSSYDCTEVPIVGKTPMGEIAEAIVPASGWESLRQDYINAITEVLEDDIKECGKAKWKNYELVLFRG
jgi:Zn-dependent M16 (insulinase) family peptidase